MPLKLAFKRQYVLLFLGVNIFIYSSNVLSENEIKNDCQLVTSQVNVDYGQISRDQIKQLSNGQGELPSRQVVAKLICPQNVEPIIKIQDVTGIDNSDFKYGQAGILQVTLNDFRVDGISTPATIVRNNTYQSLPLLKSGDEIRPKSAVVGKNTELVFNITPRVASSDITNPSLLEQSGQLSLFFAQLPSSNVLITSGLKAIACTPVVSNAGQIDYSTIHLGELSNNKITVLPARTLNLTIACDASTNVAIRARSNRPHSTPNATNENEIGSSIVSSDAMLAGLGKNLPLGLTDITQAFVVGLGNVNNQKIGGYILNLPFTQTKLDGKAAKARYWTQTEPSASTYWNKETDLKGHGGSLIMGSAPYISFGSDVNSASPSPFRHFEGILIIQAYITHKMDLDLTSPLHLDGSSTIELYYY
ncbi:DUF1120 domain-containing protein [Providencia stuartii]|uniref:DUF1120 domain-containing protein n=1 Tax=Providencia TaxID=586 RepID=UPI0027EF7FF4|nr:DUF1120 domain-containing protein [Providencia sp. 2023EL-00965]ELR5301000.1 DUF1120 domain-containing protein [Providencia stuartii]MDW7587923.1 DUF1120 domain-containing protein [Providencia sp. 2023EL-00965]